MRLLKVFTNWLPPFIWMTLIYTFSTSTFSEENTASLIIPILKALFPQAPPKTLSEIHFFIRKMSHFIEFGVLSLLWVRTLKRTWEGRPYPFILIALLISIIYAILDEVHQSFVSVRSPSYLDVLIDSGGATSSLSFLKMKESVRDLHETILKIK